MKNRTRNISMLLAILLLTGCNNQSTSEKNNQLSNNTVLDVTEKFSEGDLDASYEESTSAIISLNGNSAISNSDAVSISDSTVTIQGEGTYILSGTLDDGMVVIDAKNTDKVQLVLDGVSINSNTSAAIYVAQADKVFVSLAAGSQNSLSNGGEFVSTDENNIDAAVFSKDDLTFNGEGALTVDSSAGHGIVSKDDLVVSGGEYSIIAGKQGLSGKESVRIANGTFSITAGKDGIHAEDSDDTALGFIYLANGSYNITADGDGISASNVMQIDDGSFTIKTGGGSETVTLDANGDLGWGRPGEKSDKMPSVDTIEEDTVSVKGIKSTGNLMVNGGFFEIDSADDALHSNANLMVNGGVWNIATGDDGLHANETTKVTDGTITITKSYEGIEGQNIIISGGTIDLVASDDGLNAAGGNDQSGNGGFGGFQNGGFDTASDSNNITISGGTIHIDASGDGVDSNGSLVVTGGETYVSGPVNDGNGAMDYNGEASISGGVFIAAGSSGMAQNFQDSSTKGSMLVSVSGSENDRITLQNSNGKELLSWTAEKAFSCVVISCPEIKQGETYTVIVGSSSQTITMESLIYGSGDMGDRPSGKGMHPDITGEKPNDRREPLEGEKPPMNP